MNTSELIAVIDAEILRLQQARKLLAALVTLSEAIEPSRPTKRKYRMSAEGRKRISAAQKKRWAAQRKAAS